jgi:hypothetical protein
MKSGVFLFALMLLVSAAPARAQRGQDVMPLDRILPEIRRTHPGQFFDADGPSPGPDGSPHYHLKWMTPDGRIEWLDTDARTGRVLNSAPGRDSFDSAPRAYPQAPSVPMPNTRSRFRDDGAAARFMGGFGGFGGALGGFQGGGSRDYGERREERGGPDRGGQARERGRWRGR